MLSACSTLGVWLANVPSHVNPRLFTHSNIQYGDAFHQRLDVYTPRGASDTKAFYPVVLFLYGGGWETGYKEQYRFIADRLVKDGFVVVIPDYKKYPEAKYPDFQWDAAAAASWTKKHISEYKGDAARMHLMGHSAGAHMGAMLLADDRFLNKYNLHGAMFNSFVGLAGPYNFTPTEPKYKKIFGNGPDYSHMHVSTFIDGDEPPMFLMHGEEDTTVSYENARSLAKTISDKGGVVESKIYAEIDHLSIVGAYSRSYSPLTGDTLVVDSINWFKRYSR